jgi:hypothetical protein
LEVERAVLLCTASLLERAKPPGDRAADVVRKILLEEVNSFADVDAGEIFQGAP